jgi:hypothetical protein
MQRCCCGWPCLLLGAVQPPLALALPRPVERPVTLETRNQHLDCVCVNRVSLLLLHLFFTAPLIVLLPTRPHQDVEETKEEKLQREREAREAEQRSEFEAIQDARRLLPMFPYRWAAPPGGLFGGLSCAGCLSIPSVPAPTCMSVWMLLAYLTWLPIGSLSFAACLSTVSPLPPAPLLFFGCHLLHKGMTSSRSYFLSRSDDLLKAVEEHQVIIIVGETGSGKTTQIPQVRYRQNTCAAWIHAAPVPFNLLTI